MTETELRRRLMRLEKLVGLVAYMDARLGRMESALNRIASRVGVPGVPTVKVGAPGGEDIPADATREDLMKPILDPATDLVGATPEALAKALFRPLRPPQGARPVGQAVVSDEHAVGEPAPVEPGDRVPHLRQRS